MGLLAMVNTSGGWSCMWHFMVDPVLPLLGTFGVGVLGWFAAHWVANPIVEFERTRRDTLEELLFNRHLSEKWHPDKITQAEESLRRLSARVSAIWATSPGIVRWYFQVARGWNLAAAQSGLHGLANVKGTQADERKAILHDIEIAMGFPLTDSPDRIERIRQREDRRES